MPLNVPSFQGSHADAVTLALYKVISDSLTRPQSDALVEMLLTVLCNISPYVKSFALESSLKLLSLVERCSRPGYLFRSAYTHHGLVLLLEMITNIIQYQYEGNTMLIYSVLRQKHVFEQLANLELKKKTRSEGDGGYVASPTSDATIASHANGASVQEAPPAADPAVDSALAPNGNAEFADDGKDEVVEGVWVPTEQWLVKIKDKMPSMAIQCMVEYLSKRIEELCKKVDVIEQDEVLKYIRTTTMVGILPVPHPIVIRTYQASCYTAMWFTSYMWGVLFTRSQRMPLYDWKKIRLVVINQ